ncbi:MAG TPA: phosphate acyltransferase PlsX [Kofleriaceae bacterium]|nr:phosphate acyltransferase PlsX [Kofleriaceae bacterium]
MRTIAVDALGADAAPVPEVAGAIAAAREGACEVVLVGDRARVEEALARQGAGVEGAGARAVRGLRLEHAEQAVTMDDHAGAVFRQKPRSSLRRAVELVKTGEAAAVVSAGNSGAVLSHALFVLGRLPGVERPAIVTVFPTLAGPLTLCDVGANVEPRPTMLAQFAVLGAAYDRVVHGRARPRVGLLSNGAERGKGTELTRAAHPLLVAAAAAGAGFDYVGLVEGSDLWRGVIDVVATDGFTGNVVLKVCEGVADALFGLVRRELGSTARARAGAALARPALAGLKKRIDFAETGGALLAGVTGTVVIAHGRSDGVAIKNAIRLADRFAAAGLPARLGEAIAAHRVGRDDDATA